MINKIGLNQINYPTQPEKKEIKKTQKSGRVEEIKKQIAVGTYKIDIEKTAKALAKTLL